MNKRDLQGKARAEKAVAARASDSGLDDLAGKAQRCADRAVKKILEAEEDA